MSDDVDRNSDSGLDIDFSVNKVELPLSSSITLRMTRFIIAYETSLRSEARASHVSKNSENQSRVAIVRFYTDGTEYEELFVEEER